MDLSKIEPKGLMVRTNATHTQQCILITSLLPRNEKFSFTDWAYRQTLWWSALHGYIGFISKLKGLDIDPIYILVANENPNRELWGPVKNWSSFLSTEYSVLQLKLLSDGDDNHLLIIIKRTNILFPVLWKREEQGQVCHIHRFIFRGQQ